MPDNDTSMRNNTPTPPFNSDDLIKALAGLVQSADAIKGMSTYIQSMTSEIHQMRQSIEKMDSSVKDQTNEEKKNNQSQKQSSYDQSKLLEELQKTIKKLTEDTEDALQDIEKASESDKGKDITGSLKSQFSEYKKLLSLLQSKSSSISGETSPEQLRAIESEIRTQYRSSQKNIKSLESSRQEISGILDYIKSLDFSKEPSLLKKRTTASEQFEEERQEQIKALENTMIELMGKRDRLVLSMRAALVSGNKEQYEKLKDQLKLLDDQRIVGQKQLKDLKNLTFIKKTLEESKDNVKEIGKKFVESQVDVLYNSLRNKYLESYLKGFQDIYTSIESTRNTVSAKMKLDSGAYEELEKSIYEGIKDQGLAGSISVSDVNEMVQSMVAAGVTDEDLVTQLSLVASRLKASGSSLDLTNEETLQEILSYISMSGKSFDDALKDLDTLFTGVIGAEESVRQEFGNTVALVNGQTNTIFNQMLRNANALGKSVEEANSDMVAAIYDASRSASFGIDQDWTRNVLQEILTKKPSDLTSFESAIYQAMGGENIGSMSYEQQLSIFYDVFESLFKNASTEELKYLNDILGSNTKDNLETKKILDMINKGQDYNSKEFLESSEKNAKEIAENVAQGNYLSETEQTNKDRQNAMFEEALAAEQEYDGDKIYSEQFNAITGAIDSVYGVGKDIVKAILTSGVSGSGLKDLFGEGSGSESKLPDQLSKEGNILNKQNVTDFLKGDTSTTAGKIGTGLGYAVGGVEIIGGFVSEISEGVEEGLASEEIGTNIAGNKALWGGVGAVLGTAIGGPLGAAIGNSVGSMVAPIIGKASEGLLESWTSGMDEFEQSTSDLSDAAYDLTQAAQSQMTAAEARIDEIEDEIKALDEQKKLSDEEKKTYLIQNGYIDSQNIDTINVLDKFNEVIDAQMKQLEEEKALEERKKADAARQIEAKAILGGNAQTFANLDEQVLASTDTFAGTTDLTSDNVQSLLGKDTAKQIVDYVKDAASSGVSYQAAISSLFEGTNVSDETQASVLQYVRDFENKEKVYEQSNAEFQDRWKKIKDKNPNLSDESLRDLYIKEYGVVPLLVYDGVKIVTDDDKLPFLDDKEGTYLGYDDISKVRGQRFKTGLTEVPYDDYEALLHQGERVLTKQEAEAYNKFSSYAMNALTNSVVNNDNVSGNNVTQTFNTLETKTGEVEDAITSQTQTVQSLLKDVLKAINNLTLALSSGNKSAVNSNILRMNTNVTQLNTLT